MKTIYNYILDYQDEKLDTITTIDAMIFARLSYIHLEKILNEIPLKIKDLVKYLDIMKTNSKDKKLVEMLKDNKRFQDIEITRCLSVLDKEKEEQFLGVTFNLEKFLFIAFRGTNKNIIGYKEDLNMSFMTIPSQIEAVNYVNSEKTTKHIYLGGHSKGGNLAMYSGINCNSMKHLLIKKIYNFDGPGFLELNNKFYKMKKKIINYYPENDIVGMLMYNDNVYTPVVTSKKGIEAHNMYYWSIINDDLEFGKLNDNSLIFHDKCLELLKKINASKREIIINYVFQLMLDGKIQKLEDLKDYISNVPKINKSDKEELMKVLKSLFRCLI